MESLNKPDRPVTDLIREVIDETRALVKTEAALARDEVNQSLSAAKVSLGAEILAIQLGGIGLWMVSVSAFLGLFPRSPVGLLAVGAVLLLIAAGIGLFGYLRRPKLPLQETRARLHRDVKVIKEGIS